MLKFYYSHQSRAISGRNGDPLRTYSDRHTQRRAAQTGISCHQSKRQAARNCGWGRTVFDSSAILIYLAEKTGKFLPAKTDKARAELLSWMFFVSSRVGPYFGQSVHFRNYAPEKLPYATNRYVFEAQRHADILNARLGKQKYMLGNTYTIVDMNVWGWARLIPTVLGESGWEKFPNLKRLVDEISARPAAQKAVALKDRHKFKTEMDEEALQAMFPHLKVKVA
jgi:GST-like protein